MDEKEEKLLEAIKMLIVAKKNTADETLKDATKEELEKYMQLLEEIRGKINYLLEK